jgi:hypothetical protein
MGVFADEVLVDQETPVIGLRRNRRRCTRSPLALFADRGELAELL